MSEKRILKKIKKEFILVVSLPENSVSLAKIAEEAGADALKVHLNVEHRASGVKFGSFREEKKKIEKILKEVKIPVGIVPGEKEVCSEKELKQLEEMGIDFFDIYIKDAPVYLLKSNMCKIFALSSNFELKEAEILKKLGFVDILEASIIPGSDYGKRLSLMDLVNYKKIVDTIKKPVLIPTQKRIEPFEVKFLKEISAGGIMIGAVVFGKKAEDMKKVVSLFKKAIKQEGIN